jgi:hypothetical protein
MWNNEKEGSDARQSDEFFLRFEKKYYFISIFSNE